MIVNIHAAKTNLSKLIERAEAGEEVIIARAGKPVVRLAPIATGAPSGLAEAPGLPSWIGSMRGRIWIAPDIEAFEADVARQMEEGPIFPEGESDR